MWKTNPCHHLRVKWGGRKRRETQGVREVSLCRASPSETGRFRREQLPGVFSRLLKDHPALRRNPGEVSIDKNAERFRVEIDCGDLQPGRRVWSDVFYIGKVASGDFSLCGLVFADNLPQPKDFALTVSVTVTKTAMTVDALCALPRTGRTKR